MMSVTLSGEDRQLGNKCLMLAWPAMRRDHQVAEWGMFPSEAS